MQHRWTFLRFLSVAFIAHHVDAKLLGRDVGPSQPPERKPNLSCVLFYGDGLCIFKCRLFGQGAEGHCDNKTCICKHKDTVYIEGENGFEPVLTSLVGKRSSAGPERISSSRNSCAPGNEEDEFTTEENQLKLKLITLMEFFSKSGQDICEFMRDNRADIDAIRCLSEKERRLNGMQQSRSMYSRNIPSESDMLAQGKNIGTMVYSMIPDGCEIKRPGAQTGHPENHPRRHNAHDNDDNDEEDEDSSSGILNSKSLPNQPEKYDHLHHRNPNQKQYTLHADPTHTRSLHVVSPQHTKSKGSNSPPKVIRVPEKAGRYSFTYPLKKHNINHTLPQKPRMNISHFTPLPKYTVQPAMAQILPAVVKSSSVKNSPTHKVVASPKSNIRLQVKPTIGSKQKSAAKKIPPVPDCQKSKKAELHSIAACSPLPALNQLKKGGDRDSAIDKMHTLLGLNNAPSSKDPNTFGTPLKDDGVESKDQRKLEEEVKPQAPLLNLPPSTPADKTVSEDRAEITSNEIKSPEPVISDNKGLSSKVDQTPDESDPNKNAGSLAQDRKNLLYVEHPDATEQSDSAKSEPQPAVPENKDSRNNPSAPSADEPTGTPEIPTNVTDSEKMIDEATPKEPEKLAQNSEMGLAMERGDTLGPASTAGIWKDNDDTSETAKPLDETNYSSQNDKELKDQEKLNNEVPQRTDDTDTKSGEESNTIREPAAELKAPNAVEAAPTIKAPVETEERSNIGDGNIAEANSNPKPQTQPDERLGTENDAKIVTPSEMNSGHGSEVQLEPQIETVSDYGNGIDQTTWKDKEMDEVEKVPKPVAQKNALNTEREDALSANPLPEANTVLTGMPDKSTQADHSAVAEVNNSPQNDREFKTQDTFNNETPQVIDNSGAESDMDVKSTPPVPLKSGNEIETASEVQAPTEPESESNIHEGSEGVVNLKSEPVPTSDGRLEVENVPDIQSSSKSNEELKKFSPTSTLQTGQPNDLEASENIQPFDTTGNADIKQFKNKTGPSGQECGNKTTAPATELLNTSKASEKNPEEGTLKGVAPDLTVAKKPDDELHNKKPGMNTDAGMQTSSNEGIINTDAPSSDAKDHLTEPKDLESSENEHTPVLGEVTADQLDRRAEPTVPKQLEQPYIHLDNAEESLENSKLETNPPQLSEPLGNSDSGKESETPKKPASLNSEPEYQSTIGESKGETKKNDDKEPNDAHEQVLGELKHSDDSSPEAASNVPEESNGLSARPDSEEKSKDSPVKREESISKPTESSDNVDATKAPEIENQTGDVPLIVATTDAKTEPKSDGTDSVHDTEDKVNPPEPEVEQEDVLEEYEDDDRHNLEATPKTLGEPEPKGLILNSDKKKTPSNVTEKKSEVPQRPEPKALSPKLVRENSSVSDPETKSEAPQSPEPEPKGPSSKSEDEEKSSNDPEKKLEVSQSPEPKALSSNPVEENNSPDRLEKKSEVPQNPELKSSGLQPVNEEKSSKDPEEKSEVPQTPEPEPEGSSSKSDDEEKSANDPKKKSEVSQSPEHKSLRSSPVKENNSSDCPEKKSEVHQNPELKSSDLKPVNEEKSSNDPEEKSEVPQSLEPEPKGSNLKSDDDKKSSNDPEKTLKEPVSPELKGSSSKPVYENNSAKNPEKKLEVLQSPKPEPKSSSSKPDDEGKSTNDSEEKLQIPLNPGGSSSQPVDGKNSSYDPNKKSEVLHNSEPSNIPTVENEPNLTESRVDTNSIPLNSQLGTGPDSGATPRLDKMIEPSEAEKEDSSKPEDEQEQVLEEYDDDEQPDPVTASKSLDFSSPPRYKGLSSKKEGIKKIEEIPEVVPAHEPSNNLDKEPPNIQQEIPEADLHPGVSGLNEDSKPKETSSGKDTTSEAEKKQKGQALEPNVANTSEEDETKEEILAEYDGETPIDDDDEHGTPEKAINRSGQKKPDEITNGSIAPISPVFNNRENVAPLPTFPENLNANSEKSSEESSNRNPAMDSELGKQPFENKMDGMLPASSKHNEPTAEVSDNEEVLAAYDEDHETPLDLENENYPRKEDPSLNAVPEVSSRPQHEDIATLNPQEKEITSVPTVETAQPKEKSANSEKNSDDKPEEIKQPQSGEESVLDEYTDNELPSGADDIEQGQASQMSGIKILKDYIMDKISYDENE